VKSYSRDDVTRALAQVGIKPSDVVLVHASLLTLGRLSDAPAADAPRAIVTTLLGHLGAGGTLVAPTFNFGFCRGQSFDRQNTPSEGMGNLAEAVRTAPEAFHGAHPIQSIAAIGRHAGEICARDTESAYALGGPFDLMLAMDAQLLLFGVSLQPASLIHYAEERCAVPYRYWKAFNGSYVDRGKTEQRRYTMFVRDLDSNPRLALRVLEEEMIKRGTIRAAPLGGGKVRACTFKDFHQAATELLTCDAFALLANRDSVQAHFAAKERR
jgi:aminoglycoside N3'-acetyltransferase